MRLFLLFLGNRNSFSARFRLREHSPPMPVVWVLGVQLPPACQQLLPGLEVFENPRVVERDVSSTSAEPIAMEPIAVILISRPPPPRSFSIHQFSFLSVNILAYKVTTVKRSLESHFRIMKMLGLQPVRLRAEKACPD